MISIFNRIPRSIRLLLSLLLFTGWLSACGGGGNDNTNNQTNTDCVLDTAKIGECKIQ